MLLQVLLVLASATTGGYTQHWDAFANWNYLPAYVKRDPTYLILAPKEIRPGQTYRLAVHILRVEDKAEPVHVRASVRREGVEVAAAYQKYYEGLPDTMLIKIPDGALPGPYALFVEGHIEGAIDESLFRNTTELRFEQRTMSIFVQFNIPMYAQGTTMYFRVIPVLPDYRPYLGTVDIYIMDPWGFEVRRWLSQQSNLGAISLDYELSGDALEGEWRVKVKAGGYTEYHNFTVVGFDLRPHKDKPRMETKLFAPSTILDTDDKVGVKVVALKMSNSLVEGRCWVRAYVRKLMPDGTPLVAENENLGEKALEVYDPMFTGVRTFDFWLHDLNELGDPLAGNEIVFDVTVQDPLLNDTLHAAAHSLVFNSTVRVRFLGGQPQIFKPNMPFKAYVAVAKQSGAPLDSYVNKVLRVRVAGSARQLPGLRDIYTIPNNGIVTIDFTPPEDATYLTLEAFYDPVENDPNYRQQYGYTQGFRRSGSAYSSSNPDAPDYQPQHPDEYTTTTTASPYEIVRPVSVQSGVSMTQLKLLRYYSPDKNFLSVTTSTSKPKVGEYIIFHVNSSFYLDDLSYLIASKGNILLVDHFRMTSRMKTFEVTLSPEMAPSARIVVWHIKSDGEIIADSMNYHVDATSRNNFTVEVNPLKDYTGKEMEVIVRGDPGSYVGLSCTEKFIYTLQGGNDLSFSQIQDSMYGFDDHGNSSHQYRWSFPLQGEPDKKVYYPSNSYGVDANQTFLYAGLIAFTDANMTVTWEQCNVSAGWLRCADSRCYAAWTRCDGVNNCEDGTDESFCPERDVVDMRKYRLGRTDIHSRLFLHWFLWKDINIGSDGMYIFRTKTPKPFLNWYINAFGLSQQRGFGLIDPAVKYKGRRPYFLHIEAPDVINVGEQVGIRTSAFNFQTVEIEVLLILPKSPDYKFVKVGYHGTVEAHHPELSDREQQVLIWIPAKGGRKIYIPLVPQRMGAITVTMLGLTQMNTDTHEATFTVEPGGVIVHLHTPLVLDLTGSATNLLHLDINISETNIIPHQRDRLYISGSPTASISLVGDVFGPVQLPMTSVSMLRKYSGCGEQNMFDFAVNILTLRYLYATEQLTKDALLEDMNFLNIVYQRQMSFFTEEGGFSIWMEDLKPSTWVTAFTLRYLHRAARAAEWSDLIYIDPRLFEHSMGWLLQQNTTEGSFMQTAGVYDRKLIPDNPSTRYSNVSLTAFVLITLTEVNDLTGYVGTYVSAARLNAVRYLQNYLDRLRDPFEIAITAYALSMSNSVRKDDAFNMLMKIARTQDDMIYWGREVVPRTAIMLQNSIPYYGPRRWHKFDSLNVETTAYALMSYNLRNHWQTKHIVKWLNNQRNTDAGFISTQDTIVALEALYQFSIKSQNRHLYHFTALVEASSTSQWSTTLEVPRGEWSDMKVAQIPDAWGSVRVTASGTGLALLQLAVSYTIDVMRYYLPAFPVEAFQMDTKIIYYGFNYSTVDYDICARWVYTEESDRSGMAVIEADVPSGYVVHQMELDDLAENGNVRNLMRADFEGDRVVLYFDYMDTNPICVRFYAKRWYPVANMTQWHKVAIYDYYAPERGNVTMFEAFNLFILNICQVCGSYQCPYCPDYNGGATIGLSWMLVIVAVTTAVATAAKHSIWRP